MRSETFRVLLEVGQLDGSVEGLLHILILPVLGASFERVGECVHLTLLLKFLKLDAIILCFANISLRADEHDRSLRVLLADLYLERIDTIEGVRVVDGDAEHEAVSAVVDQLAVSTEQIISARIDDFDLYLAPADFARPIKDVKYVRDVLIGECIGVVVRNHASLADRRGTNDDESDRAGSLIDGHGRLSLQWHVHRGIRITSFRAQAAHLQSRVF